MNHSSIPLSGKEPVERTIGKVKYLFRQCIGSVEIKIQAVQGAIYNIDMFMFESAKAVDEENAGREWKKGERIEAISILAQKRADENFWKNYTPENEALRCNEIFDIICIGWEGDCYLLAEGEKPSEHVKMKAKRELVNWYMNTQYELTGEEIKN